ALSERGIMVAFAGRKRQIEVNAAERNVSDKLQDSFLLFSTLKQARIAFADRHVKTKSVDAELPN
ncbi:MAG: hypothetical protein ACRC01_05405, partial [Deefgea sp.]